MATNFTYDEPPLGPRDELRAIIGDVTENDGPTPSRANLSDELLDYYLEAAGNLPGAAARAFDHLASLWTSRPIFGVGELSTIHVDISKKYTELANLWREREAESQGSTAAAIAGMTMVRVDAYEGEASV